MKKQTSMFLFSTALFTILILLSACNLPADDQPPPVTANTAAAMTVEAVLTQAALAAPTQTPIIVSTATLTPLPCENVITFVDDVTIPDEYDLAPGAAFTKTWRVKNVGTCTWTTSYTLAFYQENSMGGPASVPLALNVAPGQTVDLSVNLVAPATAGRYTGKWTLKDQNGNFFFTTRNNPLWVIIDVVVPASGN